MNSQLKNAIKNNRQKIRTKKILNKQDLKIEEYCISYSYNNSIKVIKSEKL